MSRTQKARGGRIVRPVGVPNVWTVSHAVDIAERVAWSDTAWGLRATRHARQFADYIGPDTLLSDVGLTTLDDWAAALSASGLSGSTVNRYLAAVSRLLNIAHARDGVPSVPAIPRRKETPSRVRFLTENEENEIREWLSSNAKLEALLLFNLLIDTGLRMGEALSLQWRDVDFNTGLISVWKTKNDVPRSVPMTKRVRTSLLFLKQTTTLAPRRREYPTPKVTQKQETAIDITRDQFRQTWDTMRASLGYADDPQFVPHCLRHTCASRLVQRSVPLKVVQEWLGHKTINQTIRYAHLAPANLMAAVAALEE